MKLNRKIVIYGFLLAGMTPLASGAQIIINNLTGLYPITNLAGDLVPPGTGFVQLGAISLTDAEVMASPGDPVGLEAAFEEFGSSISFGAGGSGGFFSGTFSAPINPGDPLVGENIYIVAGDGADIGSSSGIWIFKSDEVFGDDDPDTFVETIALDGALATGTILVGTPVNVFVPLVERSFAGSQMVALVPEPGAGLLAGFAGLWLLACRRQRRPS
jgi:hypothetical protein